jgi:RNA polymerase sigma factor (sigma-70 family)
MAVSSALAVELASLRRLARALARGDAEADDLLQDVAVAAIEHPPPPAQPRVPWLIAVLRNRWRMDRRTEERRLVREAASAPEPATDDVAQGIDRARVLQRLADALVALEEPFRSTVIRRYIDGATAAQIAREQSVPAGTVRWRLHTGLARLRSALDTGSSRLRWQLALAPLGSAPLAKGALIVKMKTKLALVAIVILLAALGMWQWTRHRQDPDRAGTGANIASRGSASMPTPARAPAPAPSSTPAAPLPRRVVVERTDGTGGLLAGRVINWSTGEPVAGAELTFGGDEGAVTLHSDRDGGFELATPRPGTYTLVTITATGFLPYAPEYMHSPVRVHLANAFAIRGLRLYLYPAIDYQGRVVDGAGAPIAGAHVHLLGTPEQAIYRLPTDWTSDRDGRFVFHAPDLAVLEAASGPRRGWAALDGKVAISHQLKIVIGDAAARDASISGRVIDSSGHPVPDVLVTADPARFSPQLPRAGASAVTASDGAFRLEPVDRDTYEVTAEADGFAPTTVHDIAGGARVDLTLETGEPLAGTVVTNTGDPVPAYTLLAYQRDGVRRDLIATRSVADPAGHFELRVPKGSYQLVASAVGWAPSAPTVASAGARDVKISLSAGGIVRGVVHSATTGEPLGYARVMHESSSGGASAVPANTGTVTRADGTFELTGIPNGPFSLSFAAGGYNERIESGLVARDDVELGPLTIDLTPVPPGEQPNMELVGIGVALSAERQALQVDKVFDGSGAQAAGIVVGDRVIAVDGVAVTELGLDGAISRIRGAAGTTVGITLRRGEAAVTVVVERRKLKA